MAGKNIESLYNELFSMRATMEDLLTSAQNIVNASNQFGGEIARVLGEQMTKYYIPSLNKLIKDTNTPGSLQGVITFIDSCPLAYTRVEPSAETTSPVVTQGAVSNIVEPIGSSDYEIDELPHGASFANGTEDRIPSTIGEAMKMKKERIKEGSEDLRIHDQFVITYKYTQDYLPEEEQGERTTHVKATSKEEAKKIAQRLLGEADIISVSEVDYNADILDKKIQDDNSEVVPMDKDIAPTRELESDYEPMEANATPKIDIDADVDKKKDKKEPKSEPKKEEKKPEEEDKEEEPKKKVEESLLKKELKELKESIKGNTKQFISNVEKLIDGYNGNDEEEWLGMESTLMSMIKNSPMHSMTLAIKDYVESGSFACYYADVKKDLAEIYENTPEEEEKWNKYSDDKAWQRYIGVMCTYLPKAFKKHMGRPLGVMEESLMREATKYQVIRTTEKKSALGDVSNLKDEVVAEFDTEEEATKRCESLNKTINLDEAEIFGTKYEVRANN